ncbi:MAG: DUF4382 domain-containing protein [Bacteroidetes bacterium]|nr:DUF4382 domain-containing protein [Bacteroidota bacterium]
MKTTFKQGLFISLPLLVVGALIFGACHKNSDSGNSQLQVRLTDGPGPYDAVYIDVQKVEVNVSSDTGAKSGWQTLPLLRPGIYNLLDFRNGIDTVLASVSLPAGMLSQMRLTLGNNNSLVLNGQPYPLATPSALQSGLKFNIHATLTSGILYRLWIDFNAGSSIVTTGTGGFVLKPVIRTYSDAIGGSIKGYVLPTSAKPAVWAIQGTDTLMALPDSTGYYLIAGVPPGSWDLNYHPLDSTYKDTSFAVSVATGVVTNTGTVTLQKK